MTLTLYCTHKTVQPHYNPEMSPLLCGLQIYSVGCGFQIESVNNWTSIICQQNSRCDHSLFQISTPAPILNSQTHFAQWTLFLLLYTLMNQPKRTPEQQKRKQNTVFTSLFCKHEYRVLQVLFLLGLTPFIPKWLELEMFSVMLSRDWCTLVF